MHRIFTPAKYICVICLLVLTILLRGLSVSKYAQVFEDDQRYYLPPSNWLRVFSLGYTEASADLIWVKTLVYFGEQAINRFTAEPKGDETVFTINYIRTAIDLDPRFRNLYRRGGVLTLHQKGKITKKTIDMAIEVMEKGLEVFPNDGGIAFNLGFIYYYESEWRLSKDDKNLDLYKEKGVRLLRRAALMEGAPRYVWLLASTLLKREGLEDLMIDHLKATLANETEPQIREAMEIQLRQALGKAAERDISMSRRSQAKWRSDMPYIPYDLYLLLGSNDERSIKEVLNPLDLTEHLLDITEEESIDTSKGNGES